MKAVLKIINSMVTVSCNSKMATNIKAISKMASTTEMENMKLLLKAIIKANLKMVISTGKEYLNGRKIITTKAITKMAQGMGLENS